MDVVVPAGSFTALLGPSGCGKSTTLAMLAGLLRPDTGDITIEGRSVVDVPADRSGTGLVFQKPLLFPHLTVEQNVAFGLRMRRTGRAETRRRVDSMLERMWLGGLGDRRVGELSGGQEQRVALARALVLQPAVLLLDEPFSQLDAALRVEMRTLVKDLHTESGTTTVFVTHDQAEAVEIADTILLMLDGRAAGHGPPEMFYTAPPSLAAARFFGAGNEIPGAVRAGRFTAQGLDLHQETGLPDGPAVLVVRQEALRWGAVPGEPIPGTLESVRFAGTHLVLQIRSAIGLLAVQVPVGTAVEPGTGVVLTLPPGAGTVVAA
nr:ABC transporter ATP-binding protein [Nakamurella flavida]